MFLFSNSYKNQMHSIYSISNYLFLRYKNWNYQSFLHGVPYFKYPQLNQLLIIFDNVKMLSKDHNEDIKSKYENKGIWGQLLSQKSSWMNLKDLL